MAHQHPVKDTDLHFVIDPVTRVVENNSGKIVIMQHDHQSEIFTFELPRYIDTHDMSLSNTVRVHYINIGTSSKYTPVSGVYEVNDLQVDAANENLVTFSWTLTNNTTQLEGTLNFIIRFSCLTGDTIDYSWSTAIYSGIIVAKTIDSSDYVMTAIPDILEQWKASLKGDPFTYEDFTPEQLEGLRGPAGIIISETEPTNEDHPVWLNPDGEVGPPDLDITGASVGQIVKIKSVDSSGKPTAWEAVEFPEQVQSDWNQADETAADYVKNRPFGKVACDGIKFSSHGSDGWRLERVPYVAAFYGIQGTRLAEIRSYGIVIPGSANISASDYDGSVNIEYTSTSGNTIINISGVYDVINNINVQSSEGIGGWMSYELHIDGLYYEEYVKLSADKVDIDPKSLGLTGASVGQIVKITGVDESGKPTSWGAVDMPSGGEREWIKIGEVTTAENTTEPFYMEFTKDINGNPLSLKGVLIISTPLFSDTAEHPCALQCNDSPHDNANYFLYRSILRNNQTCTVYSEFLRSDGLNSVVVTVFNSGNVKQHGGVESSINIWSPRKEEGLQFPMHGVKFGVIDPGLLSGSKFEFWGIKK